MANDWKPLLGILAVSGMLWVLVIATRNREEISLKEKDLNNEVTFTKYG